MYEIEAVNKLRPGCKFNCLEFADGTYICIGRTQLAMLQLLRKLQQLLKNTQTAYPCLDCENNATDCLLKPIGGLRLTAL